MNVSNYDNVATDDSLDVLEEILKQGPLAFLKNPPSIWIPLIESTINRARIIHISDLSKNNPVVTVGSYLYANKYQKVIISFRDDLAKKFRFQPYSQCEVKKTIKDGSLYIGLKVVPYKTKDTRTIHSNGTRKIITITGNLYLSKLGIGKYYFPMSIAEYFINEKDHCVTIKWPKS